MDRQGQFIYRIGTMGCRYCIVVRTRLIEHAIAPGIGSLVLAYSMLLLQVIHRILVQYKAVDRVAAIDGSIGIVVYAAMVVDMSAPLVGWHTVHRRIGFKHVIAGITYNEHDDTIATGKTGYCIIIYTRLANDFPSER